ncbi:MAG: flap endonuclease-1 [Conexivisphaerales archaeon]
MPLIKRRRVTQHVGVDLGPLVKGRHIISLEELNQKVLAIDAYNSLYQFLTIIRGEGGEPLMDSHGNITSHLSGLFYRTVNIMEKGAKPLYIFDGKPPELKEREIVRRSQLKKNAESMMYEAISRGDTEAARRFASMSSRLTESMVSDAKSLLSCMGLPWVQAPSEGEAEAAYLTSKGVAWATVSQDYDSLLFGSPRLVRNLTISGRRKLPRKDVYVNIVPELVILNEVLKEIELTREQLIDVAILLGTDFNREGFKGIGHSRALNFIKKYGRLEGIVELQSELAGLDYQSIRHIFLEPSVTDIDPPVWKATDKDAVVKFLCDDHDFSRERVVSALERISLPSTSQSLEKWF